MKDSSRKYLLIGGSVLGIVIVLAVSVGLLFLASGPSGGMTGPGPVAGAAEEGADVDEGGHASSTYDDTGDDAPLIDVPTDDGTEEQAPDDGVPVEIPEARIDDQAEELSTLDSSMRLSLRRYVAAWLQSQGVDPSSEAVPTGEAVADQEGASVTLKVPALGQTIVCTYDPFTKAWAVNPE